MRYFEKNEKESGSLQPKPKKESKLANLRSQKAEPSRLILLQPTTYFHGLGPISLKRSPVFKYYRRQPEDSLFYGVVQDLALLSSPIFAFWAEQLGEPSIHILVKLKPVAPLKLANCDSGILAAAVATASLPKCPSCLAGWVDPFPRSHRAIRTSEETPLSHRYCPVSLSKLGVTAEPVGFTAGVPDVVFELDCVVTLEVGCMIK